VAITPVTELDVDDKRVFIRVDFNVPLEGKGVDKTVGDDSRIRAALPTIKYCLEHNARVILASHLGRPKGKVDPEFSLEPVAAHLAKLLDREVLLTDEPVGDGARKVVRDLRPGQIAMLENLRFDPREEQNDEAFSQALADYAEVYVNDAFGAAHRAHASTAGMVKFVPKQGAGLLLLAEVNALSKLLGNVERPYVAIIGGAKVSDKIEVLDALLGRVNVILIGGAMANTFLGSIGVAIGKSLFEKDKMSVSERFLKRARDQGVTVLLPEDAVVAPEITAARGDNRDIGRIRDDDRILDIGEKTVSRYQQEIAKARTLFWNGPMGVFEKEPFAKGTMEIARAVAAASSAFRVVGGGDSVAAVVKAGVADKIDHISTGGGASLEFIQGVELPGIQALEG
jgi:phosphoglycerate kinase